MNPTTAADSPAGVGSFRHLGCTFYDRAEFHARAAAYIADGISDNHWIEFVGTGSREQLRTELTTLPGIGDRLDAAGVGVTPATELYAVVAGIDVVDPQLAVDAWMAAMNKAIDAGYTGFRVVADATALARRPEQRKALSRFEFLLGRNMARLPFSALCAYDGSELATDVDELMCLHPEVDSDAPGFGLYPQPGVAFALTGELDAANDELYLTALRRVWSLVADDPVIIDTQRLTFVSHQQLYTLDHYARTESRRMILRADHGIITRLASVLDFTNIAVEPPLHHQTATPPTDPDLQMVST